MAVRKRTQPQKAAKGKADTQAPETAAKLGTDIPRPSPSTDSPDEGGRGAETTGRFIVVFKEGAAAKPAAIRSALSNVAGLRSIVSASDYEDGAISANDRAAGDALHFDKLGITVVTSEDAVAALAASTSDADSPVLVIEPEYVAHLSDGFEGSHLDYLRGYRDAVNHLYEQLVSGETTEETEVEGLAIRRAFRDTAQFTWGLQATKVHTSTRSGQGIRLAVLDTGMDLQHPDFAGRSIVSRSFSGAPVQDIHGHGTHCIGTSCGPQRPATGVRRYGIAFGAQIFAGKVFDNAPDPRAATGDIIAGLEWAITNGCRVVSLSLGVALNQKIQQYEVPMRRALEAGTVVVAAAGNNANRPSNPGFVEPPANADASMAVAAVDSRLRIARFSARSSQVTGFGGKVNIAAPGVAVFSSVPVGLGRHAFFDGTSMATPHVAGIAALWAQATGESGQALWNRLVQSVQPLNLPSVDVGSGLAQAPQ